VRQEKKARSHSGNGKQDKKQPRLSCVPHWEYLEQTKLKLTREFRGVEMSGRGQQDGRGEPWDQRDQRNDHYHHQDYQQHHRHQQNEHHHGVPQHHHGYQQQPQGRQEFPSASQGHREYPGALYTQQEPSLQKTNSYDRYQQQYSADSAPGAPSQLQRGYSDPQYHPSGGYSGGEYYDQQQYYDPNYTYYEQQQQYGGEYYHGQYQEYADYDEADMSNLDEIDQVSLSSPSSLIDHFSGVGIPGYRRGER
jgi:hypothetical protein